MRTRSRYEAGWIRSARCIPNITYYDMNEGFCHLGQQPKIRGWAEDTQVLGSWSLWQLNMWFISQNSEVYKTNVSMPDLSPTGKTTVETAAAAGEQNGAEDTLAPCPQHTTTLGRWPSSVCKGNYPRLLIWEPLCFKTGELKKNSIFQLWILSDYSKMNGGILYTLHAREDYRQLSLSERGEIVFSSQL